ncbi:TetR/AcrR family transcriptional regulator [Streptomyces sp. 549]|uniref:TetR/AcrR family transcriptional regulator n=1 Tax=Streptomyces sp. 549 TaxID=3049076 RepID=UPI0024C3A608|nr:TetR/AcrR family transcriptional regulator [Streptomyces sp. 549]MDK1476950.1 TetR/AcrR family transcriptional regulator [Streptomyces sp. 549]
METHDQASESSGRQEPATVRRRTGGRSARVRAQVLEATGALLLETGYDALTIDAVAERAGVHRTTVYRRWGDIGPLLADVLDAASDDTWTPPDTGSLEDDLTALNEEVYAAVAGGGPTLTTALIAAAFRSAEAAAALSRFWEARYARCAVIVTRAVARGELPGRTDSRALLVAATAPVYHELLLLRAPADPSLPRRAARAAAAAGRAGAYPEPDPRTEAPRSP